MCTYYKFLFHVYAETRAFTRVVNESANFNPRNFRHTRSRAFKYGDDRKYWHELAILAYFQEIAIRCFILLSFLRNIIFNG